MSFNRTILPSAGALIAAVLLSGCATTTKKMEPAPTAAAKSEFLKGMEVVQQPALEPEWADYVKEKYPNWRRHYWVDRGNWGNRGFLVGKAPTAEPGAVEQIQPLPPAPAVVSMPPEPPLAPPTIVESEPPKIVAPAKPTSYVVKKGDSLWKVAGKVYRNPLKWPRIYNANKDKIKNPNRIYPGMVLKIPQS